MPKLAYHQVAHFARDARPRHSESDAEYLRRLVRRIAADDYDAFAEFVDHVSPTVSRAVRGEVPDPDRASGVVAGAFVEVWWLAGGHVDQDTDVMAWINLIVGRRVADSRPAFLFTGNAPDALTASWAMHVGNELADLLRESPNPHR